MDLNQSTNSVNMDSWRDVLLEWVRVFASAIIVGWI